jgi:hypothetical protein
MRDEGFKNWLGVSRASSHVLHVTPVYWLVRQHAGLVEEIDDFAGEALEFVVEVVGEVVDALVGAFDAEADFVEVLGLLVADLVELGAELAQEFLEFLFERRAPLEVVDDLEENEKDPGECGRVDEPGREAHGVGRGQFLREDRREHEGKGVSVKGGHGCLDLGGAGGGGGAGRTGGIAKDLTALGGKISGAGPGVEAEEGEAVEVGEDVVKLLTFGVGKVDKDAVLQAAEAQVKSINIASEEVFFKSFDVAGGLRLRGVEPARLGLVEEVID